MPAAVVFDCDGTVADTESLSQQAWDVVLREHGTTLTPLDVRRIIGRPFAHNWAYFTRRVDLGAQEEFRARLRQHFAQRFAADLHVYADAVTTMQQLAERGVPLAVASSSSRAHVERVLDRGGVRALVAVIVGADDVTAHKPAPAPYLAAVERLGVAASRTTAVEDTAVGVASAVAAGLFTVGVLRAHHSAADLVQAHRVVEELTIAAVRPPPTWK